MLPFIYKYTPSPVKAYWNAKHSLHCVYYPLPGSSCQKIHTFHLVIMKNTNVFAVVCCCSDRIFFSCPLFRRLFVQKNFSLIFLFSVIIEWMKMKVDTGWIYKIIHTQYASLYWDETCYGMAGGWWRDCQFLLKYIIGILIFFFRFCISIRHFVWNWLYEIYQVILDFFFIQFRMSESFKVRVSTNLTISGVKMSFRLASFRSVKKNLFLCH